MKTLICATLCGAAASIVVSACSPTDVCGCPPITPQALVYGAVSDPTGGPVAGADITVEIADPGCSNSRYILGTGRTNTAGEYRVLAARGTSGMVGECLRARAHSPTTQWIDSNPVPFAARFVTNWPPDSIRIDLQLRDP